MIQDDEHVKISDIQALVAKGRNMTLAEQDTLKMYCSILPETLGLFDPSTKNITPFTKDQKVFVKYGLLPLVLNNVPRLHEVMAVYDLTIDSIFEWHDNSCFYSGSLGIYDP